MTTQEITIAEQKLVFAELMEARHEVYLAEKRIKALEKNTNMDFWNNRKLLDRNEARYLRNRSIVKGCCRTLDLPVLRYLP
jgi:predicted GIY-YIG superfamily endonuclease